jgi:uncharacterized protein
VDVATSSGSARLTWYAPPSGSPPPAPAPSALLLLGHGAGGGVSAPDLRLVSRLGLAAGMVVGLVEQPYRVAGRRAPAPAARLDAAFTEVTAAARAALGDAASARLPLVVGGRSSGARVACRTAHAVAAAGVLALAFPLRPPRPPGREAPSRLPELVGAGVPVLVVQGERDAFGTAAQVCAALRDCESPVDTAPVNVVVTPAAGADHALRKGIDTEVITNWLARFRR